jgi:hypothetical protein
MLQIHDGQCGLCVHFGETHQGDQQLIQIRLKHEAPETLVEECGHPTHATLDLKVTAVSGCKAFEPAVAQA